MVSDDKTATRRPRPGEPGAGQPFKKGFSGNPAGRRRGFERLVFEAVQAYVHVADDGTRLDGWNAIVQRAIKDAIEGPPRAAHDSRTWLADRVFGKAQQHVDLTGEPAEKPVNMKPLTEDQLRALAELDVDAGDGDATEH